MRRGLLALALSGLAIGAWAGPAIADEPVSGQAAEQVAANAQQASSSATSTQYQPTNQNINVRVLSPGDNGAVTQSNESTAESFAGNGNETAQAVEQSQAGAGGTAVQEAAQLADSVQKASSEATSTQVKPTNQNISVRVLSPGDDGDVTQSNSSTAKSEAKNGNETAQEIGQSQGGSDGGSMMKNAREKDHPDCGCDSGMAIQAAGQEAHNGQKAESEATSTQVKPENQSISVRVLSPGDDGAVDQSNDSTALSKAANFNATGQAISQRQAASGCGCRHGATAIQAAGQAAFNWQKADSSAESKQIEPANKALSFRFKSPNRGKDHAGGKGGGYGAEDHADGHGDGLTQSNSSFAGSFAVNWNELEQLLEQSQGSA